MNDGQLPEGLEVVPLEAALQEVAIIERKKKKTRSSKSQAEPGAVVVNIPQQKVSDSGDKSSHNDNNKPATLAIGSDLEIAKRVHVDLERRFSRVLFAEGAFWHFASTHWESIHEDELRRAVHPYDGALYLTPTIFN